MKNEEIQSVALSGEQYCPALRRSFPSIGLIRGEYLFRRYGRYPTAASSSDLLLPYLLDLAASEARGTIWYRTLEVDTREANVLRGVEYVTDDDPYPLMGLRGVRRAQAYPDHFRFEVHAIAEAAHTSSRDFGVIVPFVSTVEQLSWAISEIRNIDETLKIGTMVETPAAVLLSGEFAKLEIERLLIGVNDLSSLLGAVTRVVAKPIEVTPDLAAAIDLVNSAARRHDLSVAIAGYHSDSLLRHCRDHGIEAVVHYSDIERLFGDKYINLPERGLMQETKARTRRDIESRRSSES